jgi:hypothetical protein
MHGACRVRLAGEIENVGPKHGWAMTHYRLHILDERGDLVGAVEFECADDAAARRQVPRVLAGSPWELWRRINGSLEPETGAGTHCAND